MGSNDLDHQEVEAELNKEIQQLSFGGIKLFHAEHFVEMCVVTFPYFLCWKIRQSIARVVDYPLVMASTLVIEDIQSILEPYLNSCQHATNASLSVFLQVIVQRRLLIAPIVIFGIFLVLSWSTAPLIIFLQMKLMIPMACWDHIDFPFRCWWLLLPRLWSSTVLESGHTNSPQHFLMYMAWTQKQ